MNRRAAFAAVIAIVLSSAPVARAKGAAYAFAPDPSLRSSPIRITAAFAFGNGVIQKECVSFVNRSDKTVAAFRVTFTYIDANGIQRGVDPFDLRGSFEPACRSKGSNRCGTSIIRTLRRGSTAATTPSRAKGSRSTASRSNGSISPTARPGLPRQHRPLHRASRSAIPALPARRSRRPARTSAAADTTIRPRAS